MIYKHIFKSGFLIAIVSVALLGCASNEKLQAYEANEALVKSHLENFDDLDYNVFSNHK